MLSFVHCSLLLLVACCLLAVVYCFLALVPCPSCLDSCFVRLFAVCSLPLLIVFRLLLLVGCV